MKKLPVVDPSSNPVEAEHVRAGGSVIARIMACPGSLTAPNDGSTNEAAEKGTTAHYIGERCLMLGCEPTSFLGQTVLGQKVDHAMCDGVDVYVKWARHIVAHCESIGVESHVFLEKRVTWEAYQPPEEMRGSGDCIVVIPAMRLMIVGDYKNGVEWVEHRGNKQVRYYAAAALATLPRELTKDVQKVQLTIIQPNVPGIGDDQAVRTETIEVGDLIDFVEDAMAAVREGQQPDARRAPGAHCKYCGHKATCNERASHALTVAQQEFSVSVEGVPLEALAAMATQVEDRLTAVEAWLKDAKARIEAELKQGTPVPGFKLVPKRASRVWNDPEAVKAWATEAKVPFESIYCDPELKSPAQMEATVGKKNLPAHLYSSVSSGYNLARESSAKPAVVLPSAGDEFQATQA